MRFDHADVGRYGTIRARNCDRVTELVNLDDVRHHFALRALPDHADRQRKRYGDYIARARTWRWAAFAALAVSLVLAIGVVWQGAQSKVVPYVVEVDKLGDAVAVARADRAAPVDVRVIKAQLAAWIVDVRSVSSDPLAQKAALSRSYAMTAATATLFLNDYYRQHSPFSQNRTVAVSVDSVLPISN